MTYKYIKIKYHSFSNCLQSIDCPSVTKILFRNSLVCAIGSRKKNICYHVHFVPKVVLSIIFDFVLKDIMLKDIMLQGAGSKRRLIYCQTRKQCAILFNMFAINLGKIYSVVVI